MIRFILLIVVLPILQPAFAQTPNDICGVYFLNSATKDRTHPVKKKLILNNDSTYLFQLLVPLIMNEVSDGTWSKSQDGKITLHSNVQDFKKLSLVVLEKYRPDFEGIYIKLSTSDGAKVIGTIIFNQEEKYACGVNYVPNSDSCICIFNVQDIQLERLHVSYDSYKSKLYLIKNPQSNHFEITVDGPRIAFGYLIWNSKEAQLIERSKIIIDGDTLVKQ